ncbi:MAG: serine hydrolase domain-containing protein [Verrucomicrobiota bacterium]
MKFLFVAVLIFSSIAIQGILAADKVDQFIHEEMENRGVPGLALAIIRDGKTIKTAAYGWANVELKSPVKTETVFEIGSVTKQITAAGILLLQQQGKLSVDDKISNHFQDIPQSWTNITIRHLLAHTSGIKSYTGLDGFELTKHLTQQQFIKTLASVPMEFAPGEKWKYCNTGYSLLGYVIENVSGKKYWEFIGENIFGPLQMSLTTNREPSLIIQNRADGYEMKKGTLFNRDYDLTDVFSAGAIVSTVGDLAKWNAALDSEKLLSESSKSQMWTSAKLKDDKPTGYGFGWHVTPFQSHRNIGHSGSTSGFSASLQRFPDDKLCVILLCNSGEDNVATILAKKIASFYFKSDAKKIP